MSTFLDILAVIIIIGVILLGLGILVFIAIDDPEIFSIFLSITTVAIIIIIVWAVERLSDDNI